MLIIFLLLWLSFMLFQFFFLKKNTHIHHDDFFLLHVYLVLNYCFSLILIFPFLNLISLLLTHQPLFIVCCAYFLSILFFNVLYFWFIQQTLTYPVKHQTPLFLWIFFPHFIIFICMIALFTLMKDIHL